MRIKLSSLFFSLDPQCSLQQSQLPDESIFSLACVTLTLPIINNSPRLYMPFSSHLPLLFFLSFLCHFLYEKNIHFPTLPPVFDSVLSDRPVLTPSPSSAIIFHQRSCLPSLHHVVNEHHQLSLKQKHTHAAHFLLPLAASPIADRC